MKQKIIKIIASLFLAVLFFTTILLVKVASKEYELTIENISGTNYIETLSFGETHYSKKLVSKANKETDYVSKIDRIKINDQDIISTKINRINNIFILFDLKKSDGIVKVKYKDQEETLHFDDKKQKKDYFLKAVSQKEEIINVLKNENSNLYIFIILSLIFLVVCYFIISNILNILKKIKSDSKIKIYEIIVLFFEYFLLNVMCSIPLLEICGMYYAFFIFLQLLIILLYFKDKIKKNITFIFPLFAIILTINMAIILPPFHVPDEFTHYLKSYSLFHKDDIVINKNGKIMMSISKNVEQNINKYIFDLNSSDYRTSFKEYFIDVNATLGKGKKTGYNFGNTYGINSFAYIPSSIVINLSLLLGVPFMITALLGRIVNALIFIILGTLALSIMPKYKKLFLIILLFPITIQQVSAVNQDSLTLSIGFILMAIIFSKIFDTKSKVNYKDMFIILLLSLSLGFCKPGYFPICFLTFLIPKDRFENKKIEYATKFLPVIICFIASMNKYIAVGGSLEVQNKNIIDMSYILKHPITIIAMTINTFYIRGFNDLLYSQVNLFGWSTVYYKDFAANVIYFLYMIMILFDNKETEIKVKERISLLFISLMIIGIVYVSALISFKTTFIGASMISGLQARYFIPALLMIYIAISNDFVKINIKNKNIVFLIFIIATFLISFLTIINGFYI